jgi:uncharacterized protein CbrC (UPF0167 family)
MRDTTDMMREACDKDKVDAWQNDFWTITQEELKAFEALVRADERSALLDLVDDYAKNNTDLKAAIRARGETK